MNSTLGKYQPVIGLEIHIELNTKSKMFCRCSADYFGKAPNTHTCPICLGLPGSLPYTNEEAITSCLKIGLALNCQIVDQSLFERKNYFYPDLPKGYQISQYRWPLCIKGEIKLENGTIIRINRVHQEEDTGKLMHSKNMTLIDYNRSSVPLVEIVTEPDFHDSNEIKEYAIKLQQIVRYLGVSNADMERGDMRLEANISVRPEGSKELPNYRIELKNINSFKFMVAAVEYEIKRQIEALEKGEKLVQETRGFDEDKKVTYLQRRKEEANDYRYFSEPDIPEFRIKNLESRIKQEIPEMPQHRVERYQKDYGISKQNALILSANKELSEYFEKAINEASGTNVTPKEITNYLINQKINFEADPKEIINNIMGGKVGIIDNIEQLEKLAQEVISENPQMVEIYKQSLPSNEVKKGKPGVINVLIGLVMRKSQGKADAGKVKEILEDLFK